MTDWTLLAKSLRPPPDKWSGLEDTDLRYRHREQDLIANPEVRERFLQRAKVIAETRRWLDGEGFVEVETPVLQPIYGGALARPFVTHHNALDRDLYLRIATELYLKRLIVGGIERVYELGKDFRNEGVSFKHNPEFTMVEWYEAYADYNDAAERLEGLVAHVAQATLGTTTVERDGAQIELAPPWKRITLRDAIRDATGIDVMEHHDRDSLAKAMDIEPKAEQGWGKLVDDLLSKAVEPKLIQPTFITDYPGRDVAVRQGAPDRGGAGRALGGLRRRLRDRQRLHRAERPGRAAPPLRGAGRGAHARGRRGAADGRELHPGARVGHAADGRRRPRNRPPGDAPDGGEEPARGRSLPRYARGLTERFVGSRLRPMRGKLTYSNVMSTIAVFLALAGGSFAVAAALENNSVKSKHVKDNQLKSEDLKDGEAVEAADLAPEEELHVIGGPGEPALGDGGEGDCIWSVGDDLGQNLGFYRDTVGRIHLTGLAEVQAAPSEDCMESPSEQFEDMRVFTLPASHRPAGPEQFFTGSHSHFATVIVNGPSATPIAGQSIGPGDVVVIPTLGSEIPEGVSLGGVSFRAG